jgi:transcription-repair coupling factor (superfamily II helicase)
LNKLNKIINSLGVSLVAGAPAGFDALVLGEMARETASRLNSPILFITLDDVGVARMSAALDFLAPEVEQIEFSAWDCLPYDRVSPNSEIVGHRISSLIQMAKGEAPGPAGTVVLTTVSAVLQRVPPRDSYKSSAMTIKIGDRLDPEDLTTFLLSNGYGRSETVMEPGEFAVRGGIIDVFPPGRESPVRLDFFGDELETARAFDTVSQRSSDDIKTFDLIPVSEVLLNEESISKFRSGYRGLFGAIGGEDPLYEAVSSGRRMMGMEHWLGLFYDELETLADYLPSAPVVLDYQTEEARDARLELIGEYYQARKDVSGAVLNTDTVYNPVPPEKLYLSPNEWNEFLLGRATAQMSPFALADGAVGVDALGHPGKDFGDARVQSGLNVLDALAEHIANEISKGQAVVIAAHTIGTRERLSVVLRDHGVVGVGLVENLIAAKKLPAKSIALAVADIDRGFTGPGLTVIAEQDIFGERRTRSHQRKIKPENFIAEASSLQEGDLVVHMDHGIAQFEALEILDVAGAPHDFLRLVYDGGDKLYLPVENIELITRYGSEQAGVQLDRLGGAGWQARKAKLKKRIRDMADELIKVAAARNLRHAPILTSGDGSFDEFCARFPYTETEDQLRTISDTLGDLQGGHPMDRLVCGDVGFGKTEVALRAAFVSAMAGKQVAVVVPTTLLARQHYQVFRERFADFPIRVEQLSRFVTPKNSKETKRGMGEGTVDIVIGTHALLSKDVKFRDLGLLVIDEEQHFGVAHKEKLKSLRADVHVLTLTATPIPRTLQMALTGVRELSLIATPPVDRLAIRTFILPFDPVVIREAIQRERFRGGQIFYVCPRIEDLDGVASRLTKLVPEATFALVHGQMPTRQIEDAMNDFSDGKFDILLSTNIVESGLDLPAANTIILHRADMYGLAQLYQLRGRVGRSKIRAYAYLTLPVRQKLSKAAEKRLEVMHTLDSLGAGFSLASHDLDIRGAGNLLGGEQSGHIREVGIELYQQLLEEAVAEAKGLDEDNAPGADWSPQISLGMPVLIPDYYVTDLGVRMELYRRVSGLEDLDAIEAFLAELIDRFGPVPAEVENLLDTVAIKRLCLKAGVERIEAGPKGATTKFRNDEFANPMGLVEYITSQAGTMKVRPDQTLVYRRSWDKPKQRLEGVNFLVKRLAEIADAA